MLTIGILLISIIGQNVYAAQKRSDKGLRRQYASYNKRVKRVQNKVQCVTVHDNGVPVREDDFKHNPKGLLRYKLENAVKNRELPVESPDLAAQIHGLKRLHGYVHEEVSHNSVSTKIAPVELEEPVPVVFHADLAPTPPQEPSLCSNCVIL